MRSAGVAHGDLKRKDNVLVGPGEQPYVIDFDIAWCTGADAPLWRRKLFNVLCQMDYDAWVKLKHRRRYNEISAEDAERFQPLLLERARDPLSEGHLSKGEKTTAGAGYGAEVS